MLTPKQDLQSLSAPLHTTGIRIDGKRILLIIGGGIAAYKSLLLIRLLKGAGASVRCILTRAGAEFVTPVVGLCPVRRQGLLRPV
jgi:hypothetical protein